VGGPEEGIESLRGETLGVAGRQEEDCGGYCSVQRPAASRQPAASQCGGLGWSRGDGDLRLRASATQGSPSSCAFVSDPFVVIYKLILL